MFDHLSAWSVAHPTASAAAFVVIVIALLLFLVISGPWHDAQVRRRRQRLEMKRLDKGGYPPHRMPPPRFPVQIYPPRTKVRSEGIPVERF